MKNFILFDLDGTLAESKQPMDDEMASLIRDLLKIKKVGIISGGSYNQYQKQFLPSLKCEEESMLTKLFLFPTCSTSFYKYENGWKEVYSEKLTDKEKEKILDAFDKCFKETGFIPKDIHGQLIEDRGSQMTFSAHGQLAPLELKKVWDPNQEKRKNMKKILEKYIPEFEIRIGGTTSIDVTRKGIDKAYGVRKIEETLGITTDEILFIGDALFEGGNDYPVKTVGVECIEVSGPIDTKKIIRKIISGGLS